MRPVTPILHVTQAPGTTSPPQTPRTASPSLNRSSSPKLRGGVAASVRPGGPMSHRPNITPVGNGHSFSYNPSIRADQLSPQSSSSSSVSEAESSEPGSSRSDDSPLHASAMDTGPQRPPTPPQVPHIRASRIVTHAAFVIEELSDFDEADMDRLDVIKPYAIEYADSDRSRSRSRNNPPELDQTVMWKLRNLGCSDDESDQEDIDEDEYQAMIKKNRQARRLKRMSQGSIGKRPFSESIGSDSDREDLSDLLDVSEVGSSARRLRRRMGDRRSLQFQDPPLPRIDQLEEPETSDDELFVGEVLAKELPYYTMMYIDMEIDSP